MVICLKVYLDVGREVRGLLKRKRIYEDKFLPLKKEGFIYLPLRVKTFKFEKELKAITTKYSLVDQKLIESNRTRSFRRELQKILPRELFNNAARAYEQVGDVGIITIFPEMEPYERKIAQALKETNKGIRLVLKKVNKTLGNKRTQGYQVLAGKGTTETIHNENGVKMLVDVTKVYFSARTANERKRICSLVKEGNVLVLFSGVGPYALTIAKNCPLAKVVGVEMNKDAHKYALENAKLNNLKVNFVNDDARKFVKTVKQKFDRIIMPHPTEADYYLDDVLKVLAKNGVVHMYLFSKPEKLDYVQDKIRKIASKNRFKVKIEVVEQLHVSQEVKKYCFDIQTF
jgi:tRNA (guanine37-N1)-methyltransferase